MKRIIGLISVLMIGVMVIVSACGNTGSGATTIQTETETITEEAETISEEKTESEEDTSEVTAQEEETEKNDQQPKEGSQPQNQGDGNDQQPKEGSQPQNQSGDNGQQPKEGSQPKNQDSGEKIDNTAAEGELLLYINFGENRLEEKNISSTADDGTVLSAENFMDYYNLYTYQYEGKTLMLNEALYDFDQKGRIFLNYIEYQESSPQKKTISVYANLDYADQDVKASYSEGSIDIACNSDGTFDVEKFMRKYNETYGNAGSITLESGKVIPLTDLNIQFSEGRVFLIYGKGLTEEDLK